MTTDSAPIAERQGTPPEGWAVAVSSGRGEPGAPALRVLAETAHSSLAAHEASSCGVAFEGTLYNRAELLSALPDASRDASDAELVLHAYLRFGPEFVKELKGIFAVALRDGASERLLCVRDPWGAYPLFYADAGHELLLSTSLDALVAQPGVSDNVNVPVLAGFVTFLWSDVDETCYAAVRRVPPGSLLQVERGRRQVRRYWDPVPHGEVEMVTEEELDRFDALLEQSVERCAQGRSAGVLLSGGLDSVSVAALAADTASRGARPAPWALSLIFPEDGNEEDVQSGVAEGLHIPQLLLPVDDAVKPRGLMEAALDVARLSAAPLMNPWAGAYDRLMAEGRARGCEVMLGGGGGDELLSINTIRTADKLAQREFADVYRTLRYHRLSYGASRRQILKVVLWRNGIWPILASAAGSRLDRLAPWIVDAYRRRGMGAGVPDWAAPDPALRRELTERALRRRPRPGGKQHARRQARAALDQSLVSMEMEEYFDMGVRTGVPLLHPYFDSDLAEFLCRTPYRLLSADGRAKWPARRMLAHRFPELGFERQKKVRLGDYANRLFIREGARLWESMGGAKALAEAGIVNGASTDLTIRGVIAHNELERGQLLWDLLSLESWLRPRI